MELDLLQLSSENEDKSANSWVWISGEEYGNLIKDIINQIVETEDITKTKLIEILAKKLNVSVGPLERTIYGNQNKVPIPILKELFKFSNIEQKYKRNFLDNATHVFTARQKEVNVIKKIKEEIAEIIGAFAADGSLTVLIRIYSTDQKILENIINKYNLKVNIQVDRGKYFIRTSKLTIQQLNKIKEEFDIKYSFTYLFQIIDGDKAAVETITNKIKTVFNVSGKIKHEKNAWSVRIYNKILARYFRFFGFNYGNKTETVNAPLLIKNGSIEIKRAFCKGVLTFDGSVKYSGEIYITLKSKQLIKDLNLILSELNIKNFLTEKNNFFTITIDKDNKETLSLFIPYTKKWFRSKNYLYGFEKRVNTVEEAKNILHEVYDKYNRKSINFTEIIDFIREKKEFKSNEKVEILNKKSSSLYTKLRILNRMRILDIEGILRRDSKGKFIEKYKIYRLNNNIKDWRLPIF